MVGDICNVDWLSEQLLPTANDADVATAAVPDDVEESSGSSATDFLGRVEVSVVQPSLEHSPSSNGMSAVNDDCCPNCPYDRRHRVVVLDCRSPSDYLASHIVGAVHLAVPQLMLRRLKSGHLPASSVIGCLQDEGRENFNRHWKSEIIVLHDERSHDVISDVTSSSEPPSSTSQVISVLLRRLKEDGCKVCLLEGGYEAFNQKYPHLCVSATSGPCCSATNGVDDLERDDGINVDDGDFIEDSSRDNGPSSSMPAMCSSAPPISSTNTTALGLQRLRLHRHNRPNRPVVGHRLTQQQIYHHHNVHHAHGHHQHPIGSCNQNFSCPSSLSSSSLSSCCSSANSSNSSSVSSSSLSISSCPVTAANIQHQQLLSATASFPVEVLPYLYLGNARSSADSEALHRNGIRYILNVTPNVPNSFAGTDAFHYLQIPIDDHWSQDLTAYFPDAIAFIDEARRGRCGVLVHCLAGVSRSVTVTVAYLMHALRLSLNDAFDHVRRCKPDISPNFSFMGQLLDYERILSSERDRGQGAAGELSIDETGAESLTPSSAEDDDRKPRPLAAVAEPVGDQSMFLSPPVVSCLRPQHQKQPSTTTNCSDCRCPTSTTMGVQSAMVGPHQQHCGVCCHHEVRMTTDMVDSENGGSRGGVAAGAGGSSCYSSPVSSLSSLSSSSAVNAAVSSTSTSSSSAFDYDTIPMSSSPSPPMSNFS